ncbi:uncharacterized protein LOC130052671 isoform X2 [Ostrea edulis]|nr:uncharacterized protein LOC130052671 isoform X2 [Ostrea edulis]
MMASTKKNCSAISSTNGTELEYHCVINEWANATVEVCTANRIILFGKCSEYNHGAKRIQSSGMKICSNFTPPCPTVYNSSDAYMYQGCYNFSTTLNEISESANPPRPQTDGASGLMLGMIVSSVCLVAVLFIAGIAVYKRYYKRNIYYDSDESSQSLNRN